MLALTANAVSVIRSLVEEPELPRAIGLRIAAAAPTNGASALSVELAARPGPGDQVIEAEGARVFLDPTAVAALEDKALDAHVGNQGQVSFEIRDRSG
ncbi:Fe-S cluster assembly protein HesB [Jiangella asiatica]|uniref:Fe-S cluster assembly protein HesB n=1 Tax=Jiangella asiatica TaxID=2530372 RepID=A0A4R5D4Y1_9ACTN|nr:Fe-S cluster assembly protein HesB [Jiangella asiatica]TDE08472.1 Fe-S cluster assembly protein HesB [Jiangella asiatica]